MTSNNRDQVLILEYLDETPDYRLILGIFPLVEHMNGRVAYGVMNKAYGTTEGVGPVLPAALTTLYNLQHDLDNAREQVKAIKEGADSLIQDGGDDDPISPGFH